jgi:Tol biopolymer transport system component
MKAFFNYRFTMTAIFAGMVLLDCSGGMIMESKQPMIRNVDYSLSREIVFTSTHDGNWEIYAVLTDTGKVSRLTESFLEEEGLAPSKDGKQLAFVSRRDGDYEIYVMAMDGTGQKRLTFSLGVDEGPVWLNDNSKIIFESARDGNWEIYIMNPDGTHQVNLTNTESDEADPILSPDGNRVLFKSKRDGKWRLYAMQIDGSNLIPLAESEYIEGAHDDPTWSPNGKQIAFVTNRDGNPEIYRMDIPMTNDISNSVLHKSVKNLTGHPARDENPVWSPDGKRIAFVSDRGGDRKVFIMNPDSSMQVQVSPISIEDGTPRWSLDGQWIAYIAREDSGPFIQLVNVDHQEYRKLAIRDGKKAEVQWVPHKERTLTITHKDERNG